MVKQKPVVSSFTFFFEWKVNKVTLFLFKSDSAHFDLRSKCRFSLASIRSDASRDALFSMLRRRRVLLRAVVLEVFVYRLTFVEAARISFTGAQRKL